MPRKPRNLEVAAVIQISEFEVARYRGESSLRADGSWLINFKYDMPVRLRKHLSGSFTIVMSSTQQ